MRPIDTLNNKPGRTFCEVNVRPLTQSGLFKFKWIILCRSVLEQSCVVWGTSLTQENIENLERTQKTFAKLVLEEKYKNYEDALILLNLDSLETRRKEMCIKFAKKWNQEWYIE